MANPNDFLLNTDYELDKIVLFHEGQFTGSTSFTHKLGFTPLIFGVWSTDKDFYSVNPINGELDSSSEPGYTPTLSVRGVATSTSVQLTSGGNNSNQVLYYRVYAFQPSNSNKPVQPTANKSRKFVFNTDYNYCKLMHAGIFTHNGEEFRHNLGYVPQVIAWQQDNSTGNIRPLTVSSEASGYGLTITGNRLVCGSNISGNVHWRIYYDEA